MTARPHSCDGSFGPMVLFASLMAAATACGGGGTPKDQVPADGKTLASGPVCSSRDTTPVGVAVQDYIKTATPTPQRYLTAAGTDSAVPDDGFKVLQDKGPTYFYSSDPKAQQQIKDKLASVGPYASLLVVYRGKDEAENGNLVTVKLGGHYVGGEHDGKAGAERSIQVKCDSTGWKLVATPGAPAAAPGTPPATAPTTPPTVAKP